MRLRLTTTPKQPEMEKFISNNGTADESPPNQTR
nr:MAG TPA: hypothetical protein [Caudoviricetes sp.]